MVGTQADSSGEGAMSGEGNKDAYGIDSGGSTSSGNVAQADAAATNVNVAQTTTDTTDAAQRRANTQDGTDNAGSAGALSAATLTSISGADVAEGDSANTSDTVTQASTAQTSAGGVAKAQADTSEGTAGAGEVPLPKSDHEKQEAARVFAERWAGKGESEIGETQLFWTTLLQTVFGVKTEDLPSIIQFEKPVYVDGQSLRIDGFITLKSLSGTSRILIEQKKRNVYLGSKEKQSDGSLLTPFEQGKRYADWLGEESPRWIVTCNFKEFWVYDMKKPSKELGKSPEVVSLKDFESQWWCLAFLTDPNKEVAKRQEAASRLTGELIGDLHKLMKSKMRSPDDKEALRCLNVFCVRLVFCFYAEDTGLFDGRTLFDEYVKESRHIRADLARLFAWLDTPCGKRDERESEEMKGFPYVDGGLFADKDTPIPYIDGDVKSMIEKCGEADWSEIDPVIFGSIFESTLNTETRRTGGMHYTAPSNIDKVLDPLFMDGLTAELARAKRVAGKTARDAALRVFQEKLARLHFLDPACGSGNFLTRAYTRLRTLENEAILAMSESADLARGQGALGTNEGIVKVSIDQFYGIEINDFAVSVAKTALWIAERQMLKATERIVGQSLPALPINTQAHIFEGNALRLDWSTMRDQDNKSAKEPLKNPTPQDKQMVFSFGGDESLEQLEAMQRKIEEAKQELLQKQKEEELPHYSYDYIMGNPPFVGASMMTVEQKNDAVAVFGKGKRVHSIDYVGAWYHKAAAFIQGSTTRCAFVSTNSITQGEQVAALWGKLLNEYKVHIDFAYRSFKWQSESFYMAHVYCVIVGFSTATSDKPKVIYEGEEKHGANNINPYLLDAPDVVIASRGSPLYDVPPMTYGNKPSDDGNFILTEQQRAKLIKRNPKLECCIRRYVGAREFLNNNEVRWCLWLKGISPSVYKSNKEIHRRLEAIRAFREKSTSSTTKAAAQTPYLFFSTPQKDRSCLCIPEVSSSKRKYIPIGFLDKTVIASNKLLIVTDATLYHFGILSSIVHMAWTRTVTGRFGMGYQYSGAIVYNNFVWPKATDEQKACITQTAQAILDARAQFPDSSLADLYDDTVMPVELRRAHETNDRAVLAAYGWSADTQETDIVARLMELYQQKAGG